MSVAIVEKIKTRLNFNRFFGKAVVKEIRESAYREAVRTHYRIKAREIEFSAQILGTFLTLEQIDQINLYNQLGRQA